MAPGATKLLGLVRGTAFVPTSIAGCVGWFDATQLHPAAVDPSLLAGGGPDAWFKADAIGGHVDGDAIGTWSDSSAGGHSFTAAGTARPTYKTNILNSLPVLRFNGSTNAMAGDAALGALFSGVAACTVYVVYNTNVQTTIQNVLVWNWTGGTGGGLIVYGIDDASARRYHIGKRLNADAINETVGPTTANGAFRFYCGTDNPAVASGIRDYFSGQFFNSASYASTGVFGTGTGTCNLGSDNTGAAFFLNGDVAEIIVFKRLLTTQERLQTDSYLAAKYALTDVPAANGDVVSDWLDLSGQANNLIQSGTQRPVLELAIQNGRNIVRFASASSQQIKSGTVTTINDPLSVFVVAAQSTSAAAHTYFDGGGTAGYIRSTAVPQYRIWNGTAAGTPNTAWHQLSAIANGSSDALYVDGTAVIGPSAQGVPAMTSFSLGSDTAGANYFQGDIAEVIVYNSALSTSDRQAVEAYLKAKWGTP